MVRADRAGRERRRRGDPRRGRAVTIARYAKPCTGLERYRQPDPEAEELGVKIKLLSSEAIDGGYWVELETIGLDCPARVTGCDRKTTPVLAIEVCSTTTQTVCSGAVGRDERAQAAQITAICKSITKS